MVIIEMTEIFDFVGGDFRRPFEEGSRLVKAGYIFDVRVKRNQSAFEVFGLCLAMTDLHGPPHQIMIKITKTSSRNEILGRCSCKAGASGTCKHGTALLLKVERMSSDDLAQSTCTDLPQKWGKRGSAARQQHHFAPVPVSEFCHLPKRVRRSKWEDRIPDDILANVKEIIYKGCDRKCMIRLAEVGRNTSRSGNSDKNDADSTESEVIDDPEILYLFDGLFASDNVCGNDYKFLTSMTPDVSTFYFNHISVSQDRIKSIYSTSIGQDNFYWRKERQIRITGYSAHKYKAKMIRTTTWETRCQNLILPATPFRGNEHTKYGKEHEPVALKIFADSFRDRKIQTKLGFCVNYYMPIFGYSPDGVMDEEVLLEVKCLSAGKTYVGVALCEHLCTKSPKYLQKHESGAFTLKNTTAFYTQIQFGLAVLNMRRAKLLLYYNDSKEEGVVAVNVPRNDNFIKELLETLKRSYYTHILPFLVHNESDLLVSRQP